MKVLFTADQHFGHKNILEYCERPFTSVEEMDEGLIKQWNKVVNKDDLVYVLGDLCFKASHWRKIAPQLNGQIVLIRGNHDAIKSYITSAILEFGGETFLACHEPPSCVPENVTAVLCGHVHDEWKHKIIDGCPVINVGVDVHNYAPITAKRLLKILREVRNNEKEALHTTP